MRHKLINFPNNFWLSSLRPRLVSAGRQFPELETNNKKSHFVRQMNQTSIQYNNINLISFFRDAPPTNLLIFLSRKV